jgi:beta-phosphoglucomutase family hydrolase
MIKAVIFDMDGVLVDSEPMHKEVEKALFAEYHLDVPQELHMSFMGSTITTIWRTIKEKYNLSQSVEELVAYDNCFRVEYLKSHVDFKPIAGVEPLLKELARKNLKIALASSSIVVLIDLTLEKLQIRKYFDQIVSGDYVHHSKPAPDIFLYAAELLEVDSASCVVIEDSSNGVSAAKAAGMKCVGFANFGNQDLSAADLVVDSMEKIDYASLEGLFE